MMLKAYKALRESIKLGNFEDYLELPNGILYSPVPKAANTTIKHLFLRYCDRLSEAELNQIAKDPQSIHQILNLKYGVNRKRFIELAISGNYFCFSVLRNPVERFKSFYLDKILTSGWPCEMYGRVEIAYNLKASDSLEKVVNIACRTPDRLADIHFRSQHAILGSSTKIQNHIRLYSISQLHTLENDLKEHGLSDIPKLTFAKNSSSKKIMHTFNEDFRLYSKLIQRYKLDYSLLAKASERR